MSTVDFRAPMLAAVVILSSLLVAGCGDDDDRAATESIAESSAITQPATTAGATDPLIGMGKVELIDDGYQWTEGPQWLPDEGVLLFTDGARGRSSSSRPMTRSRRIDREQWGQWTRRRSGGTTDRRRELDAVG